MPPGTTCLEAVVRDLVDFGPLVKLTVACARLEFVVSLGKRQYNRSRFATGERVHSAVAPEDVHVLEGQ